MCRNFIKIIRMSNFLKEMIVQERNGNWKERLKNEDWKYRPSNILTNTERVRQCKTQTRSIQNHDAYKIWGIYLMNILKYTMNSWKKILLLKHNWKSQFLFACYKDRTYNVKSKKSAGSIIDVSCHTTNLWQFARHTTTLRVG